MKKHEKTKLAIALMRDLEEVVDRLADNLDDVVDHIDMAGLTAARTAISRCEKRAKAMLQPKGVE